jgi:hypothetical protein
MIVNIVDPDERRRVSRGAPAGRRMGEWPPMEWTGRALVGTVTAMSPVVGARKPACVLEIDVGPVPGGAEVG